MEFRPCVVWCGGGRRSGELAEQQWATPKLFDERSHLLNGDLAAAKKYYGARTRLCLRSKAVAQALPA